MSKVALQWFETQKIADGALTNLLYVLAYEATKGTGDCISPQSVLSRKTGMSERAVRANLVVLERLELIKRRPRNKGKYGRSSDLIALAIDRNFDVSKGSIRAVRSSLRSSKLPAHSSGSKKNSHRHILPMPPAHSAGEYNTVNTDTPFHGEDSLYLQEGTYTCEGGLPPAGGIDDLLPDAPPSNVVPFKRGAA